MRLLSVVLFSLGFALSAVASDGSDFEFMPPDPTSEFLPAVAGEPSVDFCSEWNPEFGHRGFRCCSNAVSRNVATGKRGRRKSNACAPNRIKWNFCDEMTPTQREYVQGVKAGTVDALEHIQKSMGSRGGQAFCGAGNGFLVEGRPLIPTPQNRIELRNEARCANFGTDPLIGAFEWAGREINREYHEPEFNEVRLIIGDIAAPRGGCISGRYGRRAHKSHTSGVDIDLAFFNPRAGHQPEERFTRNFYVASNWWFLKKLFKNPFSCVKVIFLDRGHIRALERYAKEDPEWANLKQFVRHVRGHRDHFHIRLGSGPGVAGCSSDPNLEEDEDQSDVAIDESAEGFLVKEDASEVNDALAEESEAPTMTEAEAMKALASPVSITQTTLPAHKQEPSITQKYAEKTRRKKRSGRRTASASRRAKK